jgi:hypothetical protein
MGEFILANFHETKIGMLWYWSCKDKQKTVDHAGNKRIISLQSFIESKMRNLVQRSGAKEMLPQESCFENKISCFQERISHNDVIMQKTWFS